MYGGLENNYKTKLNKLKSCLCGETLDLKNIFKKIDELSKYKNIERYSYLNSLLYPEKAKGCKIPSPISASSYSFQFKTTKKLTIGHYGSTGSTCWFVNPFFLSNMDFQGKFYNDVWDYGLFIGSMMSTFWENSSMEIDSSLFTEKWWLPYDLFQGAPSNHSPNMPSIYSQYRLVSAVLKVKYAGTLKDVSGTIGCGIWTTPIPFIGGYTRPRRSATEDFDQSTLSVRTGAPFGDITIDTIRHCPYFRENPLLEGFRALYFPLDNSYLEYKKICSGKSISVSYFEPQTTTATYQGKRAIISLEGESEFKNGFNWAFFVDGAPQGVALLTLELICNFECLPTPEAMQYMPITDDIPLDLHEDMNLAITRVRNKPISTYC